MGIGTHAIDGDDIDDFQSSDPWYYLVRNFSYSVWNLAMSNFCDKIWGRLDFQIHDSESNMNAVSTLRSCITTACCTGAESIGALDDCKMTDPSDHNGDTFVA